MKNSVLLLAVILFFSSCSTNMKHTFMRGTVAMKVDKKTAHICLGDNEVKAGDKILFYYHDCESPDPQQAGLRGLCTLKEIGSGEVTRTLNSHYSEVSTNGNFKFSKGTMVQKL